MATKSNIETQTLKIKVPVDTLARIDAARIAARYKTRTDYMIDSALWGAPVHLSEIAQHIGELGQICNSVLMDDEDSPEHARLEGDEAKKAVRKIIKTCDAISAALRR